nr:MAG TPA: hypothetical protein [Caudoviricetes sp.]
MCNLKSDMVCHYLSQIDCGTITLAKQNTERPHGSDSMGLFFCPERSV